MFALTGLLTSQGFQVFYGPLPERFVKCRLVRRHFNVQDDLGARRQVVQDLGLQPAQHKRSNQAAQARTGIGISVLFDGQRKVAPVLFQRTQHARIDEAEQRVQVNQVVLDWRPGSDQPEACLERSGCPGAFGRGIPDCLGLIQHGAAPFHFSQLIGVQLQDAVSGHHHVKRTGSIQQLRAGGAGVGDDVQGRGEAARFVNPVGADRSGRNHERGTVRGALQQQGQGLHSLAEPHIVGKTGARAPTAESGKPAKTFQLIRAQLCL